MRLTVEVSRDKKQQRTGEFLSCFPFLLLPGLVPVFLECDSVSILVATEDFQEELEAGSLGLRMSEQK